MSRLDNGERRHMFGNLADPMTIVSGWVRLGLMVATWTASRTSPFLCSGTVASSVMMSRVFEAMYLTPASHAWHGHETVEAIIHTPGARWRHRSRGNLSGREYNRLLLRARADHAWLSRLVTAALRIVFLPNSCFNCWPVIGRTGSAFSSTAMLVTLERPSPPPPGHSHPLAGAPSLSLLIVLPNAPRSRHFAVPGVFCPRSRSSACRNRLFAGAGCRNAVAPDPARYARPAGQNTSGCMWPCSQRTPSCVFICACCFGLRMMRWRMP